MNIYRKLFNIQKELKAPKNQKNSFGNYNYRSCEDILEAVKPLLVENGCVLTLEDSIEAVGDRIYVKATATLRDVDGEIDADKPYNSFLEYQISNTAYAREEETKKGMDGSQITGASSSYARKYALNGLFAIDDTKDSDATNIGDKETYKCEQCGKEFTDYTTKDGKFYSAQTLYNLSKKKNGKAICKACVKYNEIKYDIGSGIDASQDAGDL